ncbi:hypothetical protein [Streptomyces clavuligerus]|uniref:Uncharacterized protein n=1 Tax=Streptomyces clavuligerus TaxID=1901 RepID=B5GSU5_STRCL|nr:hypothetical protein [Streptomyces clavuligerus]ANW18441.1 hypothetical protein BB341_09440 [Streptomyces clavuligerus]AXU12996.1 hypothetical protein D1794_09770 [Streptomyces clavuligerus]EDY49391.1 hypothetical protein SSCG_02419 [Streptomyces clavuligerus]EFG08931.1 Hypothetical protein SCLAV_3859 [Streptomyces clavuligerus]MBY6302924.1 hypothetical protein [Streptomyces clavuligerus]
MPSAGEARVPVVPYITTWSSEQTIPTRIVTRGAGIGYADETLYDRDADGVLWARVSSSPGRGRPEFGQVHALRQRRAMRKLLCQVCGKPADRDERGTLWLLGEPEPDLITPHPPLCMPCALHSLRVCPHLRRRHVALRARSCTPAGVHGIVYRPGRPLPEIETYGGLLHGDPRIAWTRASQMLMRLEECTVVRLKTPVPAASP